MGNRHVKESGQELQPSELRSEKLTNTSNLMKESTMKTKTCQLCLKIGYVLLGVATVMVSLAVIALSVVTAMATKIFTTEQSGRMVGMILLIVSAAITLCATLYATVAIFRKRSKHLRGTATALVILALIQAIIAGVSVRMTPEDELILSRAMVESFQLARNDSPRHHKIWATMQYELNCCGVYSADDYKTARVPIFFPPDVPISCCPSYDPNRSELVQEGARERCKANKSYYNVGCRNLLVEMLRSSSSAVLSVTIVLIILEVISVIFISLILHGKEAQGPTEQKPKSVEEGSHTNLAFDSSRTKSPVKS